MSLLSFSSLSSDSTKPAYKDFVLFSLKWRLLKQIISGKSSPPQPAEEPSHTTPLNLSTKDASPATPDSPSSLIFDFKKFPIKRECLHSPVKPSESSLRPAAEQIVLGSVPSLKRDASPHFSSSSPHSGIWSPLAETADTKRIWSPAVSCEKENNSGNNNNNHNKVVVEVRCGGCGDVTGQFRPDTETRCHSCTNTGGLQPRQGRTFEVSHHHPNISPRIIKSLGII